MKEIFPEPIKKLPEAYMPFEGVKAFLSQSDTHQIVFTHFTEDMTVCLECELVQGDKVQKCG